MVLTEAREEQRRYLSETMSPLAVGRPECTLRRSKRTMSSHAEGG